MEVGQLLNIKRHPSFDQCRVVLGSCDSSDLRSPHVPLLLLDFGPEKEKETHQYKTIVLVPACK